MADLGHQNEDFILQCTFDQTKCHYEDFEVIQDDKYGNCFTWNHHSRNMSLRSTGPGSTHGLKLTLFTEQSEYISIYGQDSGVRVSIHEMGTTPFPEDDGFTVAPGKATGVGLKQLIINREDPPHGECSNSTSFESMYGDGYSVAACRKQCLQDYMERECGCVDTIMISDVPRCRILNQTQEICRQLMYYMLQNNMLECECALPCSEIIYLKTISQSLWPSVTYLYHLLKTIHSINDKTKDINDFEQAQSNLVRLEVYFEEMTYETMSETPKYEGVYNLLAEIGGVIGIYVGLSFITVVEFVEFFVAVVRYLFRRIKRSMKVEALK
ncbi:acid-sensing ion channel 2-like [Ptychodera flava]|uniref:acid-sensing ion channel 2-like n=1 Tax=Ptychodera flava TaxID=63121 RepID=UPI003969C4EF